jgi:hypothetical protein
MNANRACRHSIRLRTSLTGLLIAILALMSLTPNVLAQCETPQLGAYSRGAYSGSSYNTTELFTGDKVILLFNQSDVIGLVVYDTSNLDEPRLQGFRSVTGNIYYTGILSYDTNTSVLWIRTFEQNTGGPTSFYLSSFDLSDPNRILLSGSFDMTDTPLDISLRDGFIVRNGRLYVDTDDGLVIYDVSNPSVAPSQLVHFTIGSQLVPFHVSEDNNHLYTRSGNTILTLDISQLPTISIESGMPGFGATSNNLRSVFIYNDLWIVPRPSNAFEFDIFNISDPTMPTRIGRWVSPESDEYSGLYGFMVNGSNLYVSYFYGHDEEYDGCITPMIANAAKTIDLSEPSNPVTIQDETFYKLSDTFSATGLVELEGGGQILSLNSDGTLTEGRAVRFASRLAEFAPSGEYAFVTDPDRGVVMTFDLTDQTRPELVAEAVIEDPFLVPLLGYKIINTVANGHYLYLVNYSFWDDDFLLIYDMSDPEHPQFLAQQPLDDAFRLDNTPTQYNRFISGYKGPSLRGDQAIAVYQDNLDIYDWSDPAALILAGTYTSSHGLIYDAIFYDDSVLVSTDQGLEQLDISDPSAVVVTSFFPGDLAGAGIAVGSDRIYARYGLHLWSIGKELNPGETPIVASLEGTWHLDINAPITIWDNVLLATGAASQGGFYDLSDLSNPQLIERRSITYPNFIYPRRGVVWVGGAGVRDFDLQDQTELASNATTPTVDTTFGVSAAGDHAFVSDFTGGLRIFDITDPADPFEVGAYDTPDRTYETVVVGNLAYVADGAAGLVVLDVADPALLTLVGSLALSDLAIGLAVEGDFAYVATRFDGLQILDITNPATPVLVGSVDTPGSAQRVTLDGNYAFVADGTSGVQIVDITARSSPNIVGSYDTPSSARQVLIRGLAAYIPDRTTGLIALDISDPTNPQLLSTLPGLGDTRSVATWGHLAFVADFNGFVHMVDIADPGDMQLLQSVASLGTPRAVSNDGRMLYLADGDAGLTILDAQPCWFNPCPADIIEDGLLDFFDIQAYLNAYSAGDGLADWNDDGQIDFFDLQRYLIDYSAGCP